MGILSIFGYDSKSQNAYVDQTKINRDLAIIDAGKINQASQLLLGQIPGIQAGASQVFAAGDQAAAIGRANAANILAQTAEFARRASAQNKATESSNRARAAASGIQLGTGGSTDIYQSAVKEEGSRQVSFAKQAGASQANIAVQSGIMAQQQAYGQAEGILANIPGIQSQALQFQTQASALIAGGNLAVAEARANRASARSGSVLAGIGTIIAAIATYGAYAGVGAGASAAAGAGGAAGAAAGGGAAAAGAFGTSFTAGQLALGAVAVGAGGLALANIFGKSGSATTPSQLFSPTQINTSVAGVNVGGNLDSSNLQGGTQATYQALPSTQGASATTKRQFAGQQAKAKQTELNIFGGSPSPLAVVG